MNEINDIHKIYPNEDKNTIYLFEVIGSFFTDIFFNHIYVNAKIKLPKEASLLDEYIKKIQLYLIGIKNNKKCYLNVMHNLLTYYNNITESSISYSVFINLIINRIIPNNFIEQLTDFNKQELVSNIICDLVSNLALYIATPNIIKHVIEEHTIHPEDTIRILQDYSIHILITKKINILNKFLKETGEIQDTTDNPSYAIIELKKIIKQLLYEKNELIEEQSILKKQIEKSKKVEEKLRRLIELLQSYINTKNNISQDDKLYNSVQQLEQASNQQHLVQEPHFDQYKNTQEQVQSSSQMYSLAPKQNKPTVLEIVQPKPEVVPIVTEMVHPENSIVNEISQLTLYPFKEKKINPRTIIIEEDEVDSDSSNTEEDQEDIQEVQEINIDNNSNL